MNERLYEWFEDFGFYFSDNDLNSKKGCFSTRMFFPQTWFHLSAILKNKLILQHKFSIRNWLPVIISTNQGPIHGASDDDKVAIFESILIYVFILYILLVFILFFQRILASAENKSRDSDLATQIWIFRHKNLILEQRRRRIYVFVVNNCVRKNI